MKFRKTFKLFRRQPCVLSLFFVFGQRQFIAQSPAALPAQVAQQQPSFAAIDAIMQEAVTKSDIPGGVALIGHNGKVVYRKAFGSRALEPTSADMPR